MVCVQGAKEEVSGRARMSDVYYVNEHSDVGMCGSTFNKKDIEDNMILVLFESDG